MNKIIVILLRFCDLKHHRSICKISGIFSQMSGSIITETSACISLILDKAKYSVCLWTKKLARQTHAISIFILYLAVKSMHIKNKFHTKKSQSDQAYLVPKNCRCTLYQLKISIKTDRKHIKLSWLLSFYSLNNVQFQKQIKVISITSEFISFHCRTSNAHNFPICERNTQCGYAFWRILWYQNHLGLLKKYRFCIFSTSFL